MNYLKSIIFLCIFVPLFIADDIICNPGTKKQGDNCVSLENIDVMRAMHMLANPPRVICKKETVIQGISVCEDNLPKDCIIWSVVSSSWCNDVGSLKFERYWSQRCEVHLFHYTAYFKGNVCKNPPTKSMGDWEGFPKMVVKRYDFYGNRCYACFHKAIETPLNHTVHFLKVSERGLAPGKSDEVEGVQYTLLSDLFLRHNGIQKNIQQVFIRTTFSTSTLYDSVGREAEHMW